MSTEPECLEDERGFFAPTFAVVAAMSMGKPVVATPQAMRSIPAQYGRHAFIERTPEGFASSVMALLQYRALREHVGRQARALVVEHLGLASGWPQTRFGSRTVCVIEWISWRARQGA
jgi:glycosyltransferase involved in cell wall biosynthesis